MELFSVVLLLGAVVVGIAFIGSALSPKSRELAAAKRLAMLPPEEYIVLNDLLIPSTGQTTNTQIDHVVISVYGIFCIETKSHQGWIYGTERNARWTQVLNPHSKYLLHNPLRQNYGHIKAVESALGRRNLKQPIINLVTFTNAAKIIVDSSQVGTIADTKETILSYTKPIYTKEECRQMCALLQEASIVDQAARHLHTVEVSALIAACA